MNHRHEEYVAWIDGEVEGWKLSIHTLADWRTKAFAPICASLLACRDVLVRHAPNIRYCLESGESSWDSEQELLDSFTEQELKEFTPEIVEFLICDECGDLNAEVQEDADEWVYLPEAYFPCPTYTDITRRLEEVMK